MQHGARQTLLQQLAEEVVARLLRVYEDEHVAIVEVRPQKFAQPRHLTLARKHLRWWMHTMKY